MEFFEDNLLRGVVFFLALFGFWVARHIHKHKKEDIPLVCPIGFDCDAVVRSNFSRILGIPLEVLGMLYYALMSVAYLALIFLPSVLPALLVNVIVLGSLAAFLFSVYLIFIQIFVLKKGCSWCFVSAGISILIFVLNTIAYGYSLETLSKIFTS